MQPEELRETIAALGWSCRQLGRRTGYGHNVAHHWLQGKLRPNPGITDWLRELRTAIEALPPPQRDK